MSSHSGRHTRALPNLVIIIRHAEKPDDDDDIHLAPQGYTRAGALSVWFDSTRNSGAFPKIDFIFAADKSRHSNRSFETVEPLASWLGLEINHAFEQDQTDDVASEIFSKSDYDRSVVLICWHHGHIPELATALGATDLPRPEWPDDVFDRIWTIEYGDQGQAIVREVPQHLLFGDSS